MSLFRNRPHPPLPASDPSSSMFFLPFPPPPPSAASPLPPPASSSPDILPAPHSSSSSIPNRNPHPSPTALHYSEELWRACAGPLVYVPQHGDRVWYFPQGHMEQVAASTHSNCRHLPNSGLPSQILCRVVHRILSAEKETDDVYAQISLLPESTDTTACDSEGIKVDAAMAAAPSSTNGSVRMFMKILTASDTSTHGGFSVLRKHAEECLPPLDMSQDTPSQELSAIDLHGHEWKFRHTYRGQPRRHLLTTGWSVFVSHKKLIAGDAVIFLRGANDGELRVGVRRAKRQQAAQMQAVVMSSHSMHMGVVATAAHSLTTRTIFSLFYKPRLSLSPFLVPADKFAIAAAMNLSVGMRFKMRFETDDASDRSYGGTITAMADLDADNWRDSKWRSLKVKWDEAAGSSSNRDLPDRISPWEIEACVSRPVVPPPPPSPPPTRNGKRRRCSSSLLAEASGASNPSPSTDTIYPSAKLSRVLQGQDFAAAGTSPTVWRNSSSHGQLYHNHHLACLVPAQEAQKLGNPNPAQISRPSFFGDFMASTSDLNYLMIPRSAWLPPSPSPSAAPGIVAQSGCKLFGISLRDCPATISSNSKVQADTLQQGVLDEEQHPNRSDEGSRATDCSRRKSEEMSEHLLGTVESRNQSARSRTKVIKKGSMVGRGIDLSRFDSYAGLFRELEAMFHMKEGELSNAVDGEGWQVAYSDSDGDMMKVGDDPWPEFCGMVKKLHILSPEEADAWARKP